MPRRSSMPSSRDLVRPSELQTRRVPGGQSMSEKYCLWKHRRPSVSTNKRVRAPRSSPRPWDRHSFSLEGSSVRTATRVKPGHEPDASRPRQTERSGRENSRPEQIWRARRGTGITRRPDVEMRISPQSRISLRPRPGGSCPESASRSRCRGRRTATHSAGVPLNHAAAITPQPRPTDTLTATRDGPDHLCWFSGFFRCVKVRMRGRREGV